MADSYSYDAPATNGGSLLETTKTSECFLRFHGINLYAAAAYNSAMNGPIAQNVKGQTDAASNELSNLAASRKTPSKPAATGQPLTHYHSFFFELLSWKNPRASAIAYVTIVSLIFSARYLDVLRWGLKLSWMVLGVTVAAEVAGKLILNHGLASRVRPRRYYTVPRETLDAMIGDVHELVNFFVIEAQRIVFAENVPASTAALVSAFISYYLVKLVPYWGLAVIGTTVVFMVPLVYTSNKELIDQQLQNASDIINAQTSQARDVAQKQVGQVSALTKQYAGDYTGKVQELLRGRSQSPEITPKRVDEPSFQSQPQSAPSYVVKSKTAEFPEPPTEEPKAKEPEKGPFSDLSNIPEPSTIDPAAAVPAEEPVVPKEEPTYAS
ncbi:Fc.00g088990.m01.CDS01 [Cosmosporella sp. VM-42]